MGAQSAFIAEQFVPSEQQREELVTRAHVLVAAGISREEVALMLSLPLELISSEKPGSN